VANFLHGCSFIRFALDSSDPSTNAGMSIPLLSVCLATLMAFFRDPELSPLITLDDLTLLIRETATALLDPRLASTSDLNEATRTQMVKAINKVSIMALPPSVFVSCALLIIVYFSLPFKPQQVRQDTLPFNP